MPKRTVKPIKGEFTEVLGRAFVRSDSDVGGTIVTVRTFVRADIQAMGVSWPYPNEVWPHVPKAGTRKARKAVCLELVRDGRAIFAYAN